MTDKAIAVQLGISEATVNTYWGRIRVKMGPANRTELVLRALTADAEEALEHLRRENQELAQAVLRHRRTETGPATSNDCVFESLLRGIQEAVVVTDATAKIVFINNDAADLFGYQQEELAGYHVSVLVPERLRATHVEHARQYGEDPSRRQMGAHKNTLARRKDGTEFKITASLRPIVTPQGLRISCLIRDLSRDALRNVFASNEMAS